MGESNPSFSDLSSKVFNSSNEDIISKLNELAINATSGGVSLTFSIIDGRFSSQINLGESIRFLNDIKRDDITKDSSSSVHSKSDEDSMKSLSELIKVEMEESSTAAEVSS